MNQVNILFEKALQLESPWKIKTVNFDETKHLLDIYLDFPSGATFACPDCGGAVKAYDTTEKRWRHLNFFQHECNLVARVPRIYCEKHGIVTVSLPWARPGSNFTLLFEAFILAFVREMPVNKLSKIINTNGNKLWRIIYRYVDDVRELLDFSEVSQIGIDETAIKRGHNYVTLFVDLEQRRTIFVAEGKDASTIDKFKEDFIAHNGNPNNIKAASIDMSPAFIAGLKTNFPGAEIIYDKYHIIKVINTAVDKVRREEIVKQSILRNSRYVWLKNRENLTEKECVYLSNIESMPELNLKTYRAMQMRENFQEIYKEPTQEAFEHSLKKWYFWVSHSKISPMAAAAKTIKNHWNGVLKWFEKKINNGILEGLNSLVQAAKAKARGYKTFKNLSTMIYMITGKLNFDDLFVTHTI